jgi:hypothetical protein
VYLLVDHVYGAVAGGREVSFTGVTDVRSTSPQPPAGIHVDDPQRAPIGVRVEDATAKQQLLSLGRDMAPILLVVPGLWVIRRLLLSVRRGDAFAEPNVRRLRIVALLLMLVPVVEIVQHLFANAIADTIPGLTTWPESDVDFSPVVAGLVVLVLAQVFAYGVRLREDVEGTV